MPGVKSYSIYPSKKQTNPEARHSPNVGPCPNVHLEINHHLKWFEMNLLKRCSEDISSLSLRWPLLIFDFPRKMIQLIECRAQWKSEEPQPDVADVSYLKTEKATEQRCNRANMFSETETALTEQSLRSSRLSTTSPSANRWVRTVLTDGTLWLRSSTMPIWSAPWMGLQGFGS